MSLCCGGIKTPALIDTGASRTLIDSRVSDKIRNLPPFAHAPRMVSISGDDLEVQGETFVPIGNHRLMRVIVVKNLNTPLIIGADALFQAGSCVDFSAKKVTILGQSYPFLMKHTTPDAVSACTELPSVSHEGLAKIVRENRDLFGEKGTLGECTLPAVTIETGNAPPIRQKAYRMPFTKREVIETEVKKMMDQGVITPSVSPWASPVTLVPKPDGSTRFCVDYRKVNNVTTKDAHPLPHIQDIFDTLGGATIFSTLDLKSGYWQIPVAPRDRAKTAFTCHVGFF